MTLALILATRTAHADSPEALDLRAAYRPAEVTGRVGLASEAAAALVIGGALLVAVDEAGDDAFGGIAVAALSVPAFAVGNVTQGIAATAGRQALVRRGVHVSPAPIAAYWTSLAAGAGLGIGAATVSVASPRSDTEALSASVSGLVAQLVNERAYRREQDRLGSWP